MAGRQAAWCRGEPTGRETQAIYAELMGRCRGHPNDHGLACIHATWMSGSGCLPDRLGLTPIAYARLRHYHFPGTRAGFAIGGYRGIDPGRRAECEDLRSLLLRHRAGRDESEEWIADIFVAGCLGNDHLWQDLGLWSRQDLSALFRHNFPMLVERNAGDMKWKKFLYRQLCLQQGIYVCRAPSCEVCQDYWNCFGPEEGSP